MTEIEKRTFTAGLRVGKERIHSVLEAGRILNTTLELDEVLAKILKFSQKELDCERATVFLISDDRKSLTSTVTAGGKVKEINVPIDQGLSAASFKENCILNISDPYNDPRFNDSFDKVTGFKTRNILCVPMYNRFAESIGVIQVLNKNQGNFDEDDEEIASIFTTFAAVAVENAKLVKKTIEMDRIQYELSLAKTIQTSILQKEIPDFEGYDIAAISDPCYQVGGDYLRLEKLSERDYLALVADVSGKGIPAALITLALHAYLTVLIPGEKGVSLGYPANIEEGNYPDLLNSLIQKITGGKSFVSLCGLIINREDNEITCCNCGHSSSIILRSDGKLEYLKAATPVLGLLPEIKPVFDKISLNKGDIFCLYTDGIVEAASGPSDEYGNRDEFGTDRLIDILSKNRKKTTDEILGGILKAINKFTADFQKEDDLTIILIKKTD